MFKSFLHPINQLFFCCRNNKSSATCTVHVQKQILSVTILCDKPAQDKNVRKKMIDYFLRDILKKSFNATACVTREFYSSSSSPQNGGNQLIQGDLPSSKEWKYSIFKTVAFSSS